MKKVLRKDFFNRPSVIVARALLGKYLVRKIAGHQHEARITDVEVYDGIQDTASHAHKGLTRRTSVMYGPAGHWYAYLCYGVHTLLNITTREEGYPAAILIRGTDEWHGPGRLTKALCIDTTFHALAAAPHSDLWIEDRGGPREKIYCGPRIGIEYATGRWRRRHWRFFLQSELTKKSGAFRSCKRSMGAAAKPR